MLPDEIRSKLEHIIHGTFLEGEATACTTIRNQLCRSFVTGTTVKKDFEGQSVIKEEQARFLMGLAEEKDWILTHLPQGI